METGERIVRIAIKNGATLAGIANLEALRVSPSHAKYIKIVNAAGVDMIKDIESIPDDDFIAADAPRLFTWPDAVRSVLVIGLSHPRDQPELDWWDGRGTLGNRMMIDIIKRTSLQIEKELKVGTFKLHYYVEKGGLFLKDAAVLAGLGCIGKNNMLITPSFGPRIRLRALFLDCNIQPTGPIDFDPCTDCKVHCRRVCPEHAMDTTASIFESDEFSGPLPGRDGSYDRALCNRRMEKDIAEGAETHSGRQRVIKFCRRCEFVCPVGKLQREIP